MRTLLIMMGIALVAQAAFADELTRSVCDVTSITDGEGSARIVFKMDSPIELTDVAVQKATLRFTTSGTAGEERTKTLLLHPLTRAWTAGAVSWTTPWTRPGGDFDDLYARREWDLGGRGRVLAFDVTLLVKEIVEHDGESLGFLLTVDPEEGVGLPSEDLTRFEGFSSATIEVHYRHMPRVAQRG